METRPLASIALVLALVLAGCASPTGPGTDSPDDLTPEAATPASDTPGASTGTPSPDPPTDTPTETPSPTPAGSDVDPWRKIEMQGGNFSFDAAVVYRRVVRMHGLTLAEVPNVTVYVRNSSSVSLSRIYSPSAFERAVGITPVAGNTKIAGLAGRTRVFIYEGVVTDEAEREAVLAHEYAHILQFVVGAHSTVGGNVEGSESQRGRVVTGVVEGASTFVENRYRVRYLDQQPRRLDWAASRAGRTTFGAFIVAPYVFGHRYVHRRIDSVRNLSTVYEDPPQTTEQLIHNLDPDEEPALDVSVRTDTDGTAWDFDGRTTKGELFTRLVLEQELSGERAARAAAGWGGDRMHLFTNGSGGTGFVWTVRWDDAAEADEFGAALRDYLDARGDEREGTWYVNGTAYRVVRPSDGTVVLVAGAEDFVSDATVSGSGADYRVTVDGEEASTARMAVRLTGASTGSGAIAA